MKKTILSLAVASLIASSAFAFGGNCQGNMQDGMMQGKGGMTQGMHGRGGGHEMHMISMLDLSNEQRHQLAILHSEMKLEMMKLHDPKNMKKMQDLMSGESFDKKAFIKMSNENHEKMTALKANHMEKVFNILTKEQRAELKTLMDKKPMSMKGKPAA